MTLHPRHRRPRRGSTIPRAATRAFLVTMSALVLGPGPGETAASPIEVHQALVESALGNLGWRSTNAIARVVDCNVATDFARLSLVTRGATVITFAEAGDWVPVVSALGETAPFSPRSTAGFHFNSLYSFSDIEERWRELGVWVDTTARTLRPDGNEPLDMDSVAAFLGLLTHAVQDFYCHANWVTILNHHTPGDLEPAEFPLWEELVHDLDGWRERHPEFPVERALTHLRLSDAVLSEDDERGGLQTGSTRWEEFPGTEPWGHRHRHGQEQVVVHHLAERATRLWVERVERQLPSLPWRYEPRIIASAPPETDDSPGTR